ncbi:MAG: chemotaxis protein CheX [Leptospiraceae bacterium]|nr:chemotaxis protein CheX [Leptospiraceae bacterium]
MKFKIFPFLDGLQRTFRGMAGVTLENPKIGEYNEPEFFSDYTCSIGLIGIERASLILTLSEKVATEITSMITGKVLSGGEKIITDTIGELLNMAVGVAQKLSGEKFDFSLPVSVKGKSHQINVIKDKRTFRAIFLLNGEEICLYLTNSQIME